MAKWIKLMFFSALMLSLAACATENADTPETQTPTEEETPVEEEETTDTEAPGNDEDNQEDMPFEPQIEETIEIEGMEEPMTLELYNHPDAIFLTYVPEDLIVEETSSGEGESYQFFTNYEGVQRDDIYLELIIFADHITQQPSPEDEDTTFALLVEDKEEVADDQKWYDWSIQEYQSADGSANILLGEHNNRYFTMHIQSTPEFSDGFIPRVHKIIEHLYWTDTNEYLTN